MFKLIKIEDDYILTDGIMEKVDENQYSMVLLGATMKISGADKLMLIDFDKIDPFIIHDEENTEWDVEVDRDQNIYLSTQTI